MWRQIRFQFRTISNNNMVDKRICQAVATKNSVNWGNSINIKGLEIWNTGWGKFIVQMSVLGYLLKWKSVNECTANLVCNMERVGVGTAWLMLRLSPKVFHVCDFPTGCTVHYTYSSNAQWHRLPMYTKPCYNDVLVLWYQNRGTAA